MFLSFLYLSYWPTEKAVILIPVRSHLSTRASGRIFLKSLTFTDIHVYKIVKAISFQEIDVKFLIRHAQRMRNAAFLIFKIL